MQSSRFFLLVIPLTVMAFWGAGLPALVTQETTVAILMADDFDSIKVGDRVRVTLRRGGKYEGEVVEKCAPPMPKIHISKFNCEHICKNQTSNCDGDGERAWSLGGWTEASQCNSGGLRGLTRVR